MRINRSKNVKRFYYQCEDCGRQIDSYEYYAYKKCNNCRWGGNW